MAVPTVGLQRVGLRSFRGHLRPSGLLGLRAFRVSGLGIRAFMF